MREIRERLDRGDTLTLGLDYYALYSISSTFLPKPTAQEAEYLKRGGVIVVGLLK